MITFQSIFVIHPVIKLVTFVRFISIKELR